MAVQRETGAHRAVKVIERSKLESVISVGQTLKSVIEEEEEDEEEESKGFELGKSAGFLKQLTKKVG